MLRGWYFGMGCPFYVGLIAKRSAEMAWEVAKRDYDGIGYLAESNYY